jgi:hypothetical protein
MAPDKVLEGDGCTLTNCYIDTILCCHPQQVDGLALCRLVLCKAWVRHIRAWAAAIEKGNLKMQAFSCTCFRTCSAAVRCPCSGDMQAWRTAHSDCKSIF